MKEKRKKKTVIRNTRNNHKTIIGSEKKLIKSKTIYIYYEMNPNQQSALLIKIIVC